MSNDFDGSFQSALDILEAGEYLKPNFLTTIPNEDVTGKIKEFGNWFNNIAKLYFLKCDKNEREVLIFLLLNLKKNIKYALSYVNKSADNDNDATLTCCICDEKVNTKNIYHEHFSGDFPKEIMSPPGPVQNLFSENGETSSTESTSDNFIELPTKVPDNGLNSFRFNFEVGYDQRVEETLYPEALVCAASRNDHVPDYTIQLYGPCRGACLLCPCNLIGAGRARKITQFVVKNHVKGQKHMASAAKVSHTSALKKYHEYWRNQDSNFQAHQLYFMPDVACPLTRIHCSLCVENLFYSDVISHIRHGKWHKNRIVQIYQSPEGKLNEFYLLDMQLAVYDIIVENNFRKERNAESKTENHVAPAPCLIVSAVLDANNYYLPERYKDHRIFFERKEALMYCTCCKVTIQAPGVNTMKNHILGPQHKQLCNVRIPKYRYYCEICNLHVKDEFIWIRHFTLANSSHDNMAESRKKKVKEYECKKCCLVIFGDDLSLSRHLASRINKNAIRLPLPVKKLFRTQKFIEEEAFRLTNEANQVLQSPEKARECCVDLEKAISELYPKCKAYPFGSRTSGLGNNMSDLDVYMDVGDMYTGTKNQDPQSQEQFVKNTSKLLKRCKEDFNYVVPIASARTPIVKLHHCYTDLDCDISFRHALGVENTKFLKYSMDLQPVTRPFILLLKKWSDYCKINEHVTNYALAIMAIFYLQMTGFLLSVKVIRNFNPNQSLVIDGWETINYTMALDKMREHVRPYTGNLTQLLKGFFGYFAKTFNYDNDVVCPLLGNIVAKSMFCEQPNSPSLPTEMKTYFQRIQSDGEVFRAQSSFCVQDPFDLSHNLTKAIQPGTTNKFKTLCNLTCEFLETIE